MSSVTVIIVTGVLCAVACALLGVFLVLRRAAMLADAISHAILPGLVAGYFLSGGPNLLAGALGALLAAVLTVTLVEALRHSGRVGNESAIGIVFPAMFALGTYVVSRYFSNVHIDTDAVLYGSIEFAGLDVLIINGVNLGPQSLWVMSALCLINLLFVGVLYKELKLATFDAGMAATLGLSPVLIHYLLMTTVSLTTVGAFTAVGAILVIALLIVPAATAYLLTDRLGVMLALAAACGAAAALLGTALAFAFDTSVAGAIASMTGVLFTLALLFAPERGLLARQALLRRQRLDFAARTLVVHLATHEHSARAAWESAVAHLQAELRWQPTFARRVVEQAQRGGLLIHDQDRLKLTDAGRELAHELTG